MTKKKVDYFFNSVQTNGKTELTISGAIGESSYFYEATSAKDVREALENATGDIHIYLNSGGGDVFQGIEIYNYEIIWVIYIFLSVSVSYYSPSTIGWIGSFLSKKPF